MLFVVISLIRYHKYGLLCSSELTCDFIIKVSRPILYIYNEKNNISFLHSKLHLLIDFLLEDVFTTDNPTASINDREIFI